MPRVLPSQVSAFIEERFARAINDVTSAMLFPWSVNRGELVGLLKLLDQVPDELIRLNSYDFADWVVAISTLSASIEGRDTETINPSPTELGAILDLHRLLQLCPDEYPSASATDPAFIADAVLREDLHRDIGEVERALHNGEWKAATVLAGAVVEALLLWACQERVDRAKIAAAEERFKKKIGRWGLEQLIEAAHQAGAISDDTKKAASVAQGFRNLIHPGRAQRRKEKCNRATAMLSAGAVEAVIVDLS